MKKRLQAFRELLAAQLTFEAIKVSYDKARSLYADEIIKYFPVDCRVRHVESRREFRVKGLYSDTGTPMLHCDDRIPGRKWKSGPVVFDVGELVRLPIPRKKRTKAKSKKEPSAFKEHDMVTVKSDAPKREADGRGQYIFANLVGTVISAHHPNYTLEFMKGGEPIIADFRYDELSAAQTVKKPKGRSD